MQPRSRHMLLLPAEQELKRLQSLQYAAALVVTAVLNVWNGPGLPDSVRDSLLCENVFTKRLKSFFINRIRRV